MSLVLRGKKRTALRVRHLAIVTETALRVRQSPIVTGTAKTGAGLTKTASGLTKTPSAPREEEKRVIH
jgi:hypothetical protein